MNAAGIEGLGMRGLEVGEGARALGGARWDRATGEVGREGFEGELTRALGLRGLGEAVAAGREEHEERDEAARIREAAEELVSGALVRPVLARMRASNEAAAPFAPGLYEKTFAPLLDEQFASKIVRSSRFEVVDSIVDWLSGKGRVRVGAQEQSDG